MIRQIRNRNQTRQEIAAKRYFPKNDLHRDRRCDTGTRRWSALRRVWLRRYPLCVLCLMRGRTGSGGELEVDHIAMHTGDMERFWNQDNLQTLCHRCHAIAKQTHERRGGDAAAWMAYLEAEMNRCGTESYVAAMRELIPPAVREVLLRLHITR